MEALWVPVPDSGTVQITQTTRYGRSRTTVTHSETSYLHPHPTGPLRNIGSDGSRQSRSHRTVIPGPLPDVTPSCHQPTSSITAYSQPVQPPSVMQQPVGGEQQWSSHQPSNDYQQMGSSAGSSRQSGRFSASAHGSKRTTAWVTDQGSRSSQRNGAGYIRGHTGSLQPRSEAPRSYEGSRREGGQRGFPRDSDSVIPPLGSSHVPSTSSAGDGSFRKRGGGCLGGMFSPKR